MKKYKNIFGTICGFAIGTIIASITATYAATTLSSKNVYYDNTNSGGSSTNVSGAIDELYATADDQDLLTAKIIDKIYPVGSIYISTTDSTVDSVEQRFGGTWVRYATDTTLVGYKEGTNTVNATGGSKTTTLSTTNLPNHTHTTPAKSISDWATTENGGHNHNIATRIVGYSGWPQTTVSDYVLNWNTTVLSNGTGGSSSLNLAYTYNTISLSLESGNHTHTVTGTIPSMTTNSCTNCSSTPVNVQDPYTVVYMYKRID